MKIELKKMQDKKLNYKKCKKYSYIYNRTSTFEK